MNVASRLQGVAPVGGVVVGGPPTASTIDVVEYEPLEALEVKGKTESVERGGWSARGAGSAWTSAGDLDALIGREPELARLEQLDRRTLAEAVPARHALGRAGCREVPARPGILRFIDDEPEPSSGARAGACHTARGSRSGRFGEIVKAEAENVGPDAARKLAEAVAARGSLEPSERDWVRARLEPLVGLDRRGGRPGGILRRLAGFLEGLARAGGSSSCSRTCIGPTRRCSRSSSTSRTGPRVSLCSWARPGPSCTKASRAGRGHEEPTRSVASRRCRAATRPGWSARSWDQAALPSETQSAMSRAGGNPLYAEEFVRMLDRPRPAGAPGAARGSSPPAGRHPRAGVGPGADLRPSGHAVRRAQALLQDAAVIGKVFWAGRSPRWPAGVDARDPRGLHELAGKELLPRGAASIEGESEYSFWHLLVRDVAYGQIPAGRESGEARRLFRPGSEDRAGERIEDVADVLAYHASEALTLRRAAQVSGRSTGMAHRAPSLPDAGRGSREGPRALAGLFPMYEQALPDSLKPGDPIGGDLRGNRLRSSCHVGTSSEHRGLPRGGDPLAAGCGPTDPSGRCEGDPRRGHGPIRPGRRR